MRVPSMEAFSAAHADSMGQSMSEGVVLHVEIEAAVVIVTQRKRDTKGIRHGDLLNMIGYQVQRHCAIG